MTTLLICISFTLLLFCCESLGYGRRYRRIRPKCDELDPPSVKYVNFDNIAKKWYLVRLKLQSTVVRERATDGKIEWLKGTNLGIRSIRLVVNPALCSYFLREFKAIRGSRRSKFDLFVEENNITIEWRLLYSDSKYVITWGCFAKDQNNRCTDYASGIFRNKPDANLSPRDIKRLDFILRQRTCRTISEAYVNRTASNECRDFGLPSRRKCY